MPPLRSTLLAKTRRGTLAAAVLAFALTEGLAIAGTLRLLALARGGQASVRAVAEPLFLADLLVLFFVGTVVLLLLIRLVRNRIFWNAFYGVALALGVWTYAALFLPERASALLALAAVAAAYHFRRVAVTDAVLVTAIAGISVSFGASASVGTALALLVILSFYDIVAVYRTKHMVTMARELARRGVAFALLLPPDPAGLLRTTETAMPSTEFLLLGTGDLAIPAIFVAAVARVSLPQALLAAVGSIAGLAAMHAIFTRQRTPKPMPALPPIATGTILGYFISFLLL